MNLFVANLPFDTDQNALRDHFDQFGDVGKIKLIHDRETGKFRGFGFIEMSSGGERAIEALNGINFGGRPLVVNEAKPRPEFAGSVPGQGRGGNRRDRGGRGNRMERT